MLTSPDVNEKNLLIDVCYLNEKRDIRKYSRRVRGRENRGIRETLYCGDGESSILLQGSQASPVRPSDKSSEDVMMVSSGLRQGPLDSD